jgi:hypothetical protein
MHVGLEDRSHSRPHETTNLGLLCFGLPPDWAERPVQVASLQLNSRQLWWPRGFAAASLVIPRLGRQPGPNGQPVGAIARNMCEAFT